MSTATALKPEAETDMTWQNLCTKADLVEFSGVAAWLETKEGPVQVALFYIPGYETELFAVDNHDPLGNANVIARGIVGDVKGEPVVASPLYKQHYRLKDGQCLEDESVKLRTWPVSFKGDEVWVEA
ncbi:nitrite reductase small subunit NirD [Halomonas sp. McH1-25]|uniref:nitrite reductase small subunit NirD n=1 Tax=unclassified Halomonas TaxID=2609666 RepID=UPI001EF6EB09|nr:MULTISPECIES: nitrite reductase small subunit NirD [unclassified Halomonas]MCG7600126.1 nitrite reductase small subunit NirD [Halomonas sp. McH1-25]MCP1341375.1 nitrite reductase small subunit NirD [Halomonas sp. FL8]MCP1359680.1 nitrite reductase small subunit NirD [Halomonas sp. BBD45]MCP1365323.1 nitrite reductase small subunit NirD [Halomonas sp. BBD48]